MPYSLVAIIKTQIKVSMFNVTHYTGSVHLRQYDFNSVQFHLDKLSYTNNFCKHIDKAFLSNYFPSRLKIYMKFMIK